MPLQPIHCSYDGINSRIVVPWKKGLFVVLEVERVLYSIKYCEDWSDEAQVLFKEDKCYDDRYFTIFDDYVGIIAHIEFRSFWRWLSRSPYMYPVLFTLLLHKIVKQILDWLLDGLEQLAWIVCEEQSYGKFWLGCGASNPSSTPTSLMQILIVYQRSLIMTSNG